MSSLVETRKLALIALALSSIAAFSTRPTVPHQQFLSRLSAAAIERTHHSVRYVSAYVHIPYPGGDVPAETGVCTDEVIRSYRALGIDLQREVHEDIAANFASYPNHARWMLQRPDANIDH